MVVVETGPWSWLGADYIYSFVTANVKFSYALLVITVLAVP